MKDALTTFVFCALLGGFILLDTLYYPAIQGQGFGQGPAFYPRVLAVLLIAMGGLTLAAFFLARRPATDDTASAPPKNEWSRRLFLPYLILLFSIIAVLLMIYIGFFLSGCLLVFLSAALIRTERTLRTMAADAAFSLAILAVAYGVFEILIGIQLPAGILFD